METLDLHGKEHYKIERLVENFILVNKKPVKIITGSSNKMKKITFGVIKKYNFKFIYPDDYNLGTIIVYE